MLIDNILFILSKGMNVNERILTQHVEYESQAYIYAFTIELEISSAAMWCFINHLKANVTCDLRCFSMSSDFLVSVSSRKINVDD